MSNVLVYVEHSGNEPRKASLAGISFGLEMAKTTGGELHLLLIGKDAAAAAESVKGYGAKEVHVLGNGCFDNYLGESYAKAVVEVAKATNATVIAGAASSSTRDTFPRVSVALDAAMVSDVTAIVDGKTFKRPMWAGNVVATVEVSTPIAICTVRATEFDAPAAGGEATVSANDFSVDLGGLKTEFVNLEIIKSERPDLATAGRVVGGGRGFKAGEHFKMLEELADLLGAAIGASRAVCDAGWLPNDLQIGQTGKVIAPDLYIAIGISGAIQHLAGMKGSKVIVAINKDPEAPIFQVADYGLVADLFKVLPELIAALK